MQFLDLVHAGGIRPPADSTPTPPGRASLAAPAADLVTAPRAVAERMACYVLGWSGPAPEEA